MKLRPVSDLHLEFGAELDLKPIGEDVLVLAGDIHLAHRAGAAAAAWAESRPVVEIAGNHEFYVGDHAATLTALADVAERTPRLSFLDDDAVIVDGVRFVGSTLWTDFALYGDAERAKYFAWRGMNDYRQVRVGGRRLTAEDVEGWHRDAVAFLTRELAEPFDGPTVVVTHTAPSARSVHQRYDNPDDRKLNPAFASNLDELVEGSGAVLWIHGHMHSSFDYRIGRTRVVCNPRGYWLGDRNENKDFNPDLIIEV